MTSFDISSLKRRVLSGGTWALAGKMVTATAQLMINALLARLLSPQDFGAYFLAFSVVTVGAIAGSLGMNQVTVRFVAESMGLKRFSETRQVVKIALTFGALGAVAAGLLYLFVGGVLSANLFRAPALAAVTGLIAGWMATVTLQNLLAETFRGFHDIRWATTFGGPLAAVLLASSLTLTWLFQGQATLATVLFLAASASFTSILLAGWTLRRKVSSLPSQGTGGQVKPGEMFNVAGPLLITNLTLFALTQADLWILGAFRPPEEVAVYGAASRLLLLVTLPLFTVNAVMSPLIAEMYVQGKTGELERALRTTATLAGVPAFLVLLGFFLLGEPVLGLVYGDYYRDGALVLVLLSVGQLVNVSVGSCGLTLGMTGGQSVLMLISIACGAATVVVGLSVVGHYGAPGLAIANAVGLSLQSILMWLGVKRTTGMWTHVEVASLPKLLMALTKR